MPPIVMLQCKQVVQVVILTVIVVVGVIANLLVMAIAVRNVMVGVLLTVPEVAQDVKITVEWNASMIVKDI